jgi:hypothetical protein
MTREARIADRIAADLGDAEVLTRYANEIREELCRNREAISWGIFKPFGKVIQRFFIRSANRIYKKFVEPHLDEIYDDEIEEDALAWCKKQRMSPCDPPKEVLVDIVDDVKEELEDDLSQRYFVSTFKKAVQTVNPVNIAKAAFTAFRKHGFKVGLKVAAIIIVGDLILPVLAGMIHPSLFAVMHASPHTEIGIAAVAVSEAMKSQEVFEWVKRYEQLTGEDLVKGEIL